MTTEDNTTEENKIVLEKAGQWFYDKIIINHIKNTKKLSNAKEFDLNPLLAPYLSAFLTGEVTPIGIATVLVYGRALVTSITTSFGTNIQSFISDVLVDAYGSLAQGVDIVFIDKIDGEKKYAQLKLGPNTINKDDVMSINGHFASVKNLARTNNVRLNSDSLMIGVMYGKDNQLSAHYKKLRDEYHYPIFVGQNFWLRLTGDEFFFEKLIQTISNTLSSVNSSKLIEETISLLSEDEEILQLASLVNINADL